MTWDQPVRLESVEAPSVARAAVPVVPMLAPKITPGACPKVRRPATTKPTVATVVAVDDWMTAVVRAPVAAPERGVWVTRASHRCSRSSATALSPSVMILMPSRNKPRPPRV